MAFLSSYIKEARSYFGFSNSSKEGVITNHKRIKRKMNEMDKIKAEAQTRIDSLYSFSPFLGNKWNNLWIIVFAKNLALATNFESLAK